MAPAAHHRAEIGERRPASGGGTVAHRDGLAVTDRRQHLDARLQATLERRPGGARLGLRVSRTGTGPDDPALVGVATAVVHDELAVADRRRPVHVALAVALLPWPDAVDLAGDGTGSTEALTTVDLR